MPKVISCPDGRVAHPHPTTARVIAVVGCGCATLPSGHETTGTVLDLSGADNRQTIGYDYHGGDNQKVRDRPYTLHECRCLDDAELTYATGTSGF